MFSAKISIAFAASALCLALSAPVLAETFESNGQKVEVRYNDLDLNTPDGQKTLSHRLNSAATKACNIYTDRALYTCRVRTLKNIQEPVARAIAQAGTKSRFASSAVEAPIGAGN